MTGPRDHVPIAGFRKIIGDPRGERARAMQEAIDGKGSVVAYGPPPAEPLGGGGGLAAALTAAVVGFLF